MDNKTIPKKRFPGRIFRFPPGAICCRVLMGRPRLLDGRELVFAYPAHRAFEVIGKVLGSMPASGTPSAGSYTHPHTSHTYFCIMIDFNSVNIYQFMQKYRILCQSSGMWASVNVVLTFPEVPCGRLAGCFLPACAGRELAGGEKCYPSRLSPPLLLACGRGTAYLCTPKEEAFHASASRRGMAVSPRPNN